jgi:hypothetical protein
MVEALWHRFVLWLRGPRGSDASRVTPIPLEGDALRPRVLLIVFDPILNREGGRMLSDALGWHNVDALTRDFIADVRECSGGFVDFQIVDRVDADRWLVKADGYCYDEDTYLACWRAGSGWHPADQVDYEAILSDYNLLARVQADEIDEVWLFAFPYAGFYESIMVGPHAFWCNAPPIDRRIGVSRRFVIMGFNYERGVGEMLESLGHRFESHLKHTWRTFSGEANLWQQFILYDKIAPGRANCGWMHYAPNSERDYDWGNPRTVWSNCDQWLNFPDVRWAPKAVNHYEWGGGDMRAHHKWWFHHLPHAPGETRGISNNWWLYGVDPNAVR